VRGAQVEHRAAGPALLDGRRMAGEIARQHLVARRAERVGATSQRWMVERAACGTGALCCLFWRRMLGARTLTKRCGTGVSALPFHDK
jgi:hypothetical protein